MYGTFGVTPAGPVRKEGLYEFVPDVPVGCEPEKRVSGQQADGLGDGQGRPPAGGVKRGRWFGQQADQRECGKRHKGGITEQNGQRVSAWSFFGLFHKVMFCRFPKKEGETGPDGSPFVFIEIIDR